MVGIFFMLKIIAADFVLWAQQKKTLTEFDKEINNKSSELKKIEDDIRRKKLERDEERRKEEAVRKELRRIESALVNVALKQQEIRKKIRSAQKALELSRRSLSEASEDVARKSYKMRQDFNVLYLDSLRYGMFTPINGLELFKRTDILNHSKRSFLLSCEKRSFCEQNVQKWRSATEELALLENQLAENLKTQSALKEEKSRLLKDATARRISLEEEIKGLSETGKALQDMIADLEAKKKQKLREEKEKDAAARERQAAPSRFQGQLLRPIEGEVVVHFGKNKRVLSQNEETTMISNGIRIKPPSGVRDVISSAAGEVIFSGNFRSYGQMVVIDHGGTVYTVYGLLEDISVADGDKVSVGQKIGACGTNGSSVLYYEVRYDGKPVDPMLWLKN